MYVAEGEDVEDVNVHWQHVQVFREVEEKVVELPMQCSDGEDDTDAQAREYVEHFLVEQKIAYLVPVHVYSWRVTTSRFSHIIACILRFCIKEDLPNTGVCTRGWVVVVAASVHKIVQLPYCDTEDEIHEDAKEVHGEVVKGDELFSVLDLVDGIQRIYG